MKIKIILTALFTISLVAGFLTLNINATWYWKGWTPWGFGYPDYAPSGIPDFDQRQNASWVDVDGLWSHCGPVAVANCLWWIDSAFESGGNGTPPLTISDNFNLTTSYNITGWDDHAPQNVDPLVSDLAWRMDTNGNRTGIPHNGTYVYDMELALDEWLKERGLNDSSMNPWGIQINETTISFYCMEEFEGDWRKAYDFLYTHLTASDDIILLLGFWQFNSSMPPPFHYNRIGGHYVTLAGMTNPIDQGYNMAFSDPIRDKSEALGVNQTLFVNPPLNCSGISGTGFPKPTHNASHGPSVHNDAEYVSHDVYAIGPTPTPYHWGPLNYNETVEGFEDISCFFDLQNFANQTQYDIYKGEYIPGSPVITEIEFAVIISYNQPPPPPVPEFPVAVISIIALGIAFTVFTTAKLKKAKLYLR
jgi:hypothetical protein